MIEYNNFRIGNEDSYFKLEQLGRVLIGCRLTDRPIGIKCFETYLGAFCELTADGTDLGNAMRGFDYSFGCINFWIFCYEFNWNFLFLHSNKGRRQEMMYSQQLMRDNISQLLIMTMTPTQMVTAPTKMDLAGGSIGAVLQILMLLIIRT